VKTDRKTFKNIKFEVNINLSLHECQLVKSNFQIFLITFLFKTIKIIVYENICPKSFGSKVQKLCHFKFLF